MTRQNIFEILKSKYDIKSEMNKIIELVSIKMFSVSNFYGQRVQYTAEELFDNVLLRNWKQRGSYLSSTEIKRILQIPQIFNKEMTEIMIITTLEYYENIFYLIYKNLGIPNNPNYETSQYYSLTIENMNILLEHLNYEMKIFENEEKVILIPRKPEATAVAEISSEETALAILMYNHHSMKGDIEGKRTILYKIAHEYETLLKKPREGYNDFFVKTNALLNNLHIRHDNKTKEGNKNPVIEIDDKELENWYDELYQLLLFCVLIHDNLERKNRVADFLKSIKENKCKD